MKSVQVEKRVANLHDKRKYIIHTRNLISTLNYGLVFKKLWKTIKFNQKALLKSNINMNADLIKKKIMIWKKYFLNLCIIPFLVKLWKMW